VSLTAKSSASVVVCHQRVVASLVCGATMREAIRAKHHVAFAAGLGGDRRGQAQALHRCLNRLHVTLRTRMRDLEGLAKRHERLALQGAADDVFQRVGQM
jgi:hypothetical protein